MKIGTYIIAMKVDHPGKLWILKKIVVLCYEHRL
jgi:hypothetical protein